jgi:soluble lytic murein transglycosylase-like protein
MDPIDAQIAALEAEIAKEQAALATPAPVAAAEPSGYGLRQLAFDVPTGVARAGAGLADVLSYPVVKGLEYAGAPVETFGLSKLLSAGAEAAAPTLGVRPETEMQELVSFLTPSPLSKAKLLGQAGTGLAAYLGSETAQAVAPESEYAGLIGALLGPSAASTTAKVAKGVVNKVAPTVGLIAGSDEALRNAAQAEVLANAGEVGAARLELAQSLSSLSEGTGGVPLTAAEIAQTPSLAKYQQAIRQTQEGGDILTPAIETRQTELAAALNRLGVEPQQGDFALALRETAEQAATSKTAKEASMLETLGLTEQIKAATPTERGKLLRDAITERKDVADDLAEQAWLASPGDTKLDITAPLKATIDDFAGFGELAKADIGEKAKRVIRKVEDVFANQNGIVTVDELQDIRSAAGRAMAEASGTNPRQARLMATLRENLDTAGIKYFYDQASGVRGGLPGTASTATDLNALEKLSDAIQKTRESKQLFSQGVVGEITAIRQFKPKLATSKVIDRAVANPENAEEILSKFGKDSVEATTVRAELLSRIDTAKNPTDFIGKNKQVLKTVFGGEYDTLVKYAQSKGRGAPFEEFSKITDTAIPNKIFADTAQAKKFVNSFKDTELLQYARSKFINTKLTKSGDPLDNLNKNRKIAEVYFPGDLSDLEAVLKDMQLAKSPQQLAAAATKGQSWTSQMSTTLGAIMSARGLVGAMKKGTGTGALIGFGAGPVGPVAGAVGGYILSRVGSARESQLNELAAQFLANPSLLKFAKAPPTQQNVKTLLDRAAEMGYLGSKAAQEFASQPSAEESAALPEMDIDAQIEAVTREIEALRGESAPVSESVKVGKQNISIPTGEEFAPPSFVKAVMKVESGGKQEAVSPKGARGLMQLMPATAKELGVDIDDPQDNVKGGSKYLRQMLNKYGSKELAAAAYNWGPGNIDRAIKQVKAAGKKVTWQSVLDEVKVPRETRNYVSKVISLEV